MNSENKSKVANAIAQRNFAIEQISFNRETRKFDPCDTITDIEEKGRKGCRLKHTCIDKGERTQRAVNERNCRGAFP